MKKLVSSIYCLDLVSSKCGYNKLVAGLPLKISNKFHNKFSTPY